MNNHDFEKYITRFINDRYKNKDVDIELNNEKGRYKSWNLLRNYYFKNVKGNPINSLEDERANTFALGLYTYLGSWGMFRSSLLMKAYNYTILKEVVQILSYSNYDDLSELKRLEDFTEDKIQLLVEVFSKIEDHFKKLKFKTTNTLVSKIILGVYGCMPAYDSNVTKAMRHLKIQANYNNHTVSNAIKNLIEYSKSINIESNNIVKKELENYPIMKLIDMWLFGLGIDLNKK